MPDEEVIASGKIENIGFDKSLISFKTKLESVNLDNLHIADHKEGLNFIIDKLTNSKTGVIKDKKEIYAVGHRILNVGDKVSSHAIINDKIIQILRDCIELAPLHNPSNLIGVEVSLDVFGKDTTNVGVFDTVFHNNMPPHAFLYGLPYEYYEKYRIRKYGAHGIAYTYMANKGPTLIGKDLKDINTIILMLGGGSSITAVRKGISIDTSLSLIHI